MSGTVQTLGVLALESSVLNSSFQGLKFVLVGYNSIEGDGEERVRFWRDWGMDINCVF